MFLETAEAKGKTMKPGSSCLCIVTQVEEIPNIKVVETNNTLKKKKRFLPIKEIPRPY